MKKTLKHIVWAALLLAGMSACNDMDLSPKSILSEETLFNSDYGIKKYLSGVYDELPIEDFNYAASGDIIGYGVSNSLGSHPGNFWEALKNHSSVQAAEASGRGNHNMSGSWGYWPYKSIRAVNVFINNLPEYKENFQEEKYLEYLGEGHFLRAFYYFGLVKRYGGIPIITEAQDPTSALEELQVPRNTEYDCWKFIYNDLKYAMEHMSDDRTQTGRANRYAAAALMSKAMLYAASIANYNRYTGITGEATDKGLMGMDSSHAEEFYQYAYDACKFIAEAGYTLHRGSDKIKAYKEVFIEDCSTDEDIFVKIFGEYSPTLDRMALQHNWDTMVLPKGTNMANFVGATIHPVWDLISLYETPDVVDQNGNPVRFNSLSDFWNTDKMEARCKANFFFSGMTEPVSGTVLDIQAGVYSEYPGSALDGCPESNVETEYTERYRTRASNPGTVQTVGNFGEVKINGANGYATGAGDEGYSTTGVFVQKYVNYNADPSTRDLFKSSQNWKVFRYGEILCNWAEAAYELGLIKGSETLKQEAIQYINELRDRAGATPYTYKAGASDVGMDLYGFSIDENLKFIRDERKRELCFENQSDWDQRRWRIAHSIYNNYLPKVLFGYKVLNEDKYIFLNEAEVFGRRLTYDKKFYYEQIPASQINKNPNLVRNDGY